MLFMCVRLFMLFIRESMFIVFCKERLIYLNRMMHELANVKFFMLFKFTCTVYKIKLN
jgi:hypothetical protein